MIYTKPEVQVLGDAIRVIQGMKIGPVFDGPPPYGTASPPPPACEIDA